MSGAYPSAYPVIQDWDEYTSGILPDICANGDGADMFRILVAPFRPINTSLAAAYAGAADIEDAEGPVIDLIGDSVGEYRQGLSDELYRRIVAGRLVASAGGVLRRKLYAGWVALTGSSSARMEEPGNSSVLLTAGVGFVPTEAWLLRAGSVVRALVGGGYQADASVTVPRTARFGSPMTPFGVGEFAYQLRIQRGT